MKLKQILFLVMLLSVTLQEQLVAQAGIGTNLPNSSAQLEVVSSNKGILLPQIALTGTTDATTIANGNVTSLLVYNTATVADVTPGYYFWDGASWNRINDEPLDGHQSFALVAGDKPTTTPADPTTESGDEINGDTITEIYDDYVVNYTYDGTNWTYLEYSRGAKDRYFADDTTVAPAAAGEPTVAEMQAFATAESLTNRVIYYTGTDTDTDTPTHVFHADDSGVVTLLERPISEPWFGTDDNARATSNTEDIYQTGDVAIGSTTVNDDANLELGASDKGLLLNRVALTATDDPAPLTAHVAGMVVYNTATAGAGATAVNPGLYYNNGANWEALKVKVNTIVYSAEYAGATLYADGTDNFGDLTSDNAGSANNWMNYYEWSSSQVTNQDYDVVFRFTIPSDFTTWGTGSIVIDYMAETGSNFSANLYAETSAAAMATIPASTSATWSTVTIPAASLATLGAGDTAVLVLKLTSANDAIVRIGDVTITYTK